MSKMGARNCTQIYKKRCSFETPFLSWLWVAKESKMGGFLREKVKFFLIKYGPQSKSRNLEQTFALPIQTKGSDPLKMLLFRAVGYKKRVPERGEEDGMKKGGKGRKMEVKWEPEVVKKAYKKETKKRYEKRRKNGGNGEAKGEPKVDKK